MATQIFVSHITEDAAVAAKLKLALRDDFLGQLTIFLSSDTDSITAGEDWLSSVSKALRDSSMVIVLCSPEAVDRPRVNFEAGAAWMRDVPLIPVCFGGLKLRALRMPLSARQGLELSDGPGLRRLYSEIARVLGFQLPPRDYDALAADLSASTEWVPAVADAAGISGDKAIRGRLGEALMHPRYKWRSLDRVAAAAAIPADRAAARYSKPITGSGSAAELTAI